jgi:hypothetical protein
MSQFRIVDLTSRIVETVRLIEGTFTAEAAARKALGFDVVLSGPNTDLVARVYWQSPGQPMTMVSVYRRVTDGRATI